MGQPLAAQAGAAPAGRPMAYSPDAHPRQLAGRGKDALRQVVELLLSFIPALRTLPHVRTIPAGHRLATDAAARRLGPAPPGAGPRNQRTCRGSCVMRALRCGERVFRAGSSAPCLSGWNFPVTDRVLDRRSAGLRPYYPFLAGTAMSAKLPTADLGFRELASMSSSGFRSLAYNPGYVPLWRRRAPD